MRAIFLFFLLLSGAGFSQEDAADCRDHPAFPRMKNCSISSCVQAYEKVPVKISDTQSETREGLKTDIDYVCSSAKGPSFAEIISFYESLVTSKGGKKVYVAADLVTFSVKSGDNTIWLMLSDQSNMAPGNYGLLIVESENLKQELNAKELGLALGRSGSAMLYLNFDAGKSELKSEMQKQLNEVVIMLRQHPFTKLSIEAHTDNALDPQQSLAISEARARSVASYLNSKGIGRFRISAKGHGQTKPVADNNSEEGKQRNNRIELIKR